MANTIKIKYSDTAAAVPTLVAGEIAINRADKILYYTDGSNAVKSFSIAGDLTGITNASANSSYPAGGYAFNALTSDGFAVDGRLTGTKNDTLNVQRLQAWSTGATYARQWNEGTASWSAWSIYLDAQDFTAKGQTHFSSASNVAGVLVPGTDGQVLTLDNTQPLGVKWAAAGAGSANLGDLHLIATNTTLQADYGIIYLGRLRLTDTAKFINKGTLRLENVTNSGSSNNSPVFYRVLNDASTTGQVLVDISGLSAELEANSVYNFQIHLQISASSQYGVQYTGSGSLAGGYLGTGANASAVTVGRITSFNAATASVNSAGTSSIITLTGTIITTTAGTFTVRHLKVTSGTNTVYAGSFLMITKVT